MNTTDPQAATAEDVLDFWFDGADQDVAAAQQQMSRWFRTDPALDQQITARYRATLGAARVGALEHWTTTADGWLALLIVLDQFSRNIHRGTPQAFAADAQACALALAGIERGDEQRITPVARLFCYLPLEHAEDAALQQRSVALFTALHDAAAQEDRDLFARTLDFAQQHAQVIERFGRFPHRNAILGRSNTAAEAEYLAQPDVGF